MISPKQLWNLLQRTIAAWKQDRAPSMGAALAYYTAFALAPLLLIVIGVAALVFGRDAAQAAIIDQVQGLLGTNGAEAINAMLASASDLGSGVWATLFGIAMLTFGATTAFVEMQDDLDRIWNRLGFVGLCARWGYASDLVSQMPEDERAAYLKFGHLRIESAFAGRVFILYRPTGLNALNRHREPHVLSTLLLTDFMCDAKGGSSTKLVDQTNGMTMTVSHPPKRIFDYELFMAMPSRMLLRWDARYAERPGAAKLSSIIRRPSRSLPTTCS